MTLIDFPLPTDADRQRLVGALYAESSAANTGGEDDGEKRAIALTIINMAYYATFLPSGARRCYNTTFGDGTVLEAVKMAIRAYGGPAWREVMAGDALKPKAQLEALDPGRVAHLRFCVAAVDAIADLKGPRADDHLQSRIPIQFNQATDSPPHPPRQERVGRQGSHTFYAFKTGRECQ